MKKLLLATSVFALLSVSVAKADMFSLHLTQSSTSIDAARGFDSVTDLFDYYKNGKLDSIFSAYDDTKASTGVIDFRGIEMTLSFNNSAVLTFSAPEAGISPMTFDGGSQKESFKMFRNYLKNNKDNLLKKILSATVQNTPYDMVAGSPNSLMATMADNAFERGGGGLNGNFVSYLSPNASIHHFKYKGKSKKANVYALPLGKSFQFSNGSALIFDMPISYTDMDGSASYAAQLGTAFKIQTINNDKLSWNLTPAARIGVVGSEEMLSGGILYSGSLTSNIRVPVGKITYSLTNMVGYIRDMSVNVAGYEVDYDLSNIVYKNGFALDWKVRQKWRAGASYDYTFYTGSDLFIDHYHDMKLFLTKELEKGKYFSAISLVADYSFDGDDYYAYKLGLNFSF